jgi:hypothetical protein
VSRKNQICHLSVCSSGVFFSGGIPKRSNFPRPLNQRHDNNDNDNVVFFWCTAKPSPIPPSPSLCWRYYPSGFQTSYTHVDG